MNSKFIIAAIATASLVSTAPMAFAQSSKANEMTKSDGLIQTQTTTKAKADLKKSDMKKSMNSMTNGQKANTVDGRTPDTRKNSAEGSNAGAAGGVNAGGSSTN